jgi:hypothetical protein
VLFSRWNFVTRIVRINWQFIWTPLLHNIPYTSSSWTHKPYKNSSACHGSAFGILETFELRNKPTISRPCEFAVTPSLGWGFGAFFWLRLVPIYQNRWLCLIPLHSTLPPPDIPSEKVIKGFKTSLGSLLWSKRPISYKFHPSYFLNCSSECFFLFLNKNITNTKHAICFGQKKY